MTHYEDRSFDIAISSEVLEHIKEYGMQDVAIRDMRRITRSGGLLIIATPNTEMLEDHGFAFDELNTLLSDHFDDFVIFENALVPYNKNVSSWNDRLTNGNLGVIVEEMINLDETALPKGIIPEIKKGLRPGEYTWQGYKIDTTLLHNTHSWVVLGINDKD